MDRPCGKAVEEGQRSWNQAIKFQETRRGQKRPAEEAISLDYIRGWIEASGAPLESEDEGVSLQQALGVGNFCGHTFMIMFIKLTKTKL